MISYLKTPIIEVKSTLLEVKGVRLMVKREDLNHPEISGNKWWKLKYNLIEARKQAKDTLLTFGGAYSNHIYATAAAGDEAGFKSIGIIRGEETPSPNPTLNFATQKGMRLHYVSREAYRKKSNPDFVESLQKQFGDFYLIPEGGTNALAVKGVVEFAKSLLTEIQFDVLCLPVGTGGTLAGIISAFEDEKEILGVSILKDGGFLVPEVSNLVRNFSHRTFENWSLLTDYHHGGYAKSTEALLHFMEDFDRDHNLPLDHVYTGKMIWAVMEEVKENKFKRGTTILAIHTGGLQVLAKK